MDGMTPQELDAQARHWHQVARNLEQQRDTAWAELREIRDAIGANPEESTADEVRRVLALTAKGERAAERHLPPGHLRSPVDWPKSIISSEPNTAIEHAKNAEYARALSMIAAHRALQRGEQWLAESEQIMGDER